MRRLSCSPSNAMLLDRKGPQSLHRQPNFPRGAGAGRYATAYKVDGCLRLSTGEAPTFTGSLRTTPLSASQVGSV